jgi:hypothetical protein
MKIPHWLLASLRLLLAFLIAALAWLTFPPTCNTLFVLSCNRTLLGNEIIFVSFLNPILSLGILLFFLPLSKKCVLVTIITLFSVAGAVCTFLLSFLVGIGGEGAPAGEMLTGGMVGTVLGAVLGYLSIPLKCPRGAKAEAAESSTGQPVYDMVIVAFGILVIVFWPLQYERIQDAPHNADVEKGKCQSWLNYEGWLKTSIIDYVTKNPSKVTFVGKYDVVRIAGLGDYLRSQDYVVHFGIPVKGDDIIDPWGDPVEIIVEHSQPMMLVEGPGNFYRVDSPKGNKIAIGLYVPKQHSLSVSNHEQWQVRWVPN